jgi:two-component system phosphate regulon response regulator PhoB
MGFFVIPTPFDPGSEIGSVDRMATTLPALDVHGLDRPIVTLLVDRDTDTREMYAEFLRQCGHEVEEAQDGREALAKALSRRVDVVVTDTRLPGISGVDLCKLLRRDASTATLPIVFVTSDTSDDDVQRASRAGATLVLAKPCRPDQLASQIQQIVIGVRTSPPRSAVARPQTAERPEASRELADAAPGAGMSELFSAAPVYEVVCRRRERAAPGTVGLLRMPDRVRHLPVQAPHAEPPANQLGLSSP